jgi:hypothetical protein
MMMMAPDHSLTAVFFLRCGFRVCVLLLRAVHASKGDPPLSRDARLWSWQQVSNCVCLSALIV